MESSEEEQSQGHGDVEEGKVVSTGGEEHPGDETEDHPDIFVHTECHRVKHLQVGVDAHNSGGEVDHHQLQDEHGQGRARGCSQDLGREPVLHPQHVAHHQDVGHEGHGGNIEVGSVQFVSWLHGLVVTVSDGPGRRYYYYQYIVEVSSPVRVQKWEQQESQLLGDVGVVHSKVILENN